MLYSMEVGVDDAQVAYHKACALRSYLLILVSTSIFMDKNVAYVGVIYLKNFIHLEMIIEYN